MPIWPILGPNLATQSHLHKHTVARVGWNEARFAPVGTYLIFFKDQFSGHFGFSSFIHYIFKESKFSPIGAQFGPLCGRFWQPCLASHRAAVPRDTGHSSHVTGEMSTMYHLLSLSPTWGGLFGPKVVQNNPPIMTNLGLSPDQTSVAWRSENILQSDLQKSQIYPIRNQSDPI